MGSRTLTNILLAAIAVSLAGPFAARFIGGAFDRVQGWREQQQSQRERVKAEERCRENPNFWKLAYTPEKGRHKVWDEERIEACVEIEVTLRQ